jgi:hypothetical protein
VPGAVIRSMGPVTTWSWDLHAGRTSLLTVSMRGVAEEQGERERRAQDDASKHPSSAACGASSLRCDAKPSAAEIGAAPS